MAEAVTPRIILSMEQSNSNKEEVHEPVAGAFSIPSAPAAPATITPLVPAASGLPPRPPKKPRKKILFLNHSTYGNPNDPQHSEIMYPTLNYCIKRKEDTFYVHPASVDCVVFDDTTIGERGFKPRVFKHKLNIEPLGACMHCECSPVEGKIFTVGRIPLTRSYDAILDRYVVWGNFCCFGCAIRYQLEHPTSDGSYIIMLLHKMAAELWGIPGPIHAMPPKICFIKYGGTVDPETMDREMPSHQYTIHEGTFISYPMMIQCQPLNLQNNNKESSDSPYISHWIARGLEPPRESTKSTKATEITTPIFGNECLFDDFIKNKPLVEPLDASAIVGTESTQPTSSTRKRGAAGGKGGQRKKNKASAAASLPPIDSIPLESTPIPDMPDEEAPLLPSPSGPIPTQAKKSGLVAFLKAKKQES